MFKKFDWVWVVSDLIINPNNYRNNDTSTVDKTDIKTDINPNNDTLTDIHLEINSETTNNIVESFKIVQSNYIPNTNDLSINKYLIDSSIDSSIDSTNNFQDKTFTEKNKFTKSIKNIINTINAIEDESFDLPINNFDTNSIYTTDFVANVNNDSKYNDNEENDNIENYVNNN